MTNEKPKRSQISLNADPALLARIEAYFHARRFRTRKEAILHLLDVALAADPPNPAAIADKGEVGR